jgi:hypothetical protein
VRSRALGSNPKHIWIWPEAPNGDPQLREQVELVRKGVWEVIGQLTGRAENMAADGVGLDLRLKWSHNELKRYAPTCKVSLREYS